MEIQGGRRIRAYVNRCNKRGVEEARREKRSLARTGRKAKRKKEDNERAADEISWKERRFHSRRRVTDRIERRHQQDTEKKNKESGVK